MQVKMNDVMKLHTLFDVIYRKNKLTKTNFLKSGKYNSQTKCKTMQNNAKHCYLTNKIIPMKMPSK
jgi:hypothetical protein